MQKEHRVLARASSLFGLHWPDFLLHYCVSYWFLACRCLVVVPSRLCFFLLSLGGASLVSPLQTRSICLEFLVTLVAVSFCCALQPPALARSQLARYITEYRARDQWRREQRYLEKQQQQQGKGARPTRVSMWFRSPTW